MHNFRDFFLEITYQIIYLFIFLFYVPFYLLKKRRKDVLSTFLRRLNPSLFKDEKTLGNLKGCLWIHGVSVGEITAMRVLVDKLKKKYPEEKILITTITPAGYKVANSFWKDKVLFFPLDFIYPVRKFLNLLQPKLFVILETEIWPETLWAVKRRGIPAVLVNGRISDKSFPLYRRIKFFLRVILKKIDFFIMQSPLHKQRILSLGVEPSKVEIIENLKYESSLTSFSSPEEDFLGHYNDIPKKSKPLLAASTHSGEEKIILDAYKEIEERFKDSLLIIAPRHPQRSAEIAKIVEERGFKPVLFSKGWRRDWDKSVFIMDKIGFLRPLYKLSYLSFVGGSLLPFGGHNILEPASFKKPIISGPYFFNFQDIFERFIEMKAILIVKNTLSLKKAIIEILEDRDFYESLSQRGFDILNRYRNISDRYIQYLKNYF